MPETIRAVFDTSSLIFLDHLGYLPQVNQYHDIITTPDVVRELHQKEGAGSGVSHLPWIEQRSPQTSFLESVTRNANLDLGETSVIALGLQLALTVVLDDNAARRFALEKGLALTGTLGVLLDLHRQTLAARSLEQDLESLTDFGMYISDELRGTLLTNL